MDKKDLKKEFLMYTSLNILGMVGLSCYILADTFFVSNGLGINGLTALNLAIPVYSLIRGVGLMLGIGGATKYTIFNISLLFISISLLSSVINPLLLSFQILFMSSKYLFSTIIKTPF